MTIGTSVTCGSCGETLQFLVGLPEATWELLAFGLAHVGAHGHLQLWITSTTAAREASFAFVPEVINERMCQWIGAVLIDDNGSEVCEVVASRSPDGTATWRVDVPDGTTHTFESEGQALAAARHLVGTPALPRHVRADADAPGG